MNAGIEITRREEGRRALPAPPSPDNSLSRNKTSPRTTANALANLNHESNNGSNHDRRGDLSETLDPLLSPRNPQKRAGRSKGSQNYTWSPAADAILVELAGEHQTGKAKWAMFHRLEPFHGAAARTKPDAYRKAVKYRLAKLGLPIGDSHRSGGEKHAHPWTEAQAKALIGSLGEDVSLETIAKRTGHTVKAVRAKMARLGYTAADIPGFATAELATLLLVTSRQIARWKEKQWLKTKNHRITEESVRCFLRAHSDRIDFDKLSYEAKIYLADLGYPSESRADFRKAATEILSGLGRDRKGTRQASESGKIQKAEEKIGSSRRKRG